MDDASNQAEFHFVVTYSERELTTFRLVAASRLARAHMGPYTGIMLAAILVLGLGLFGAFKLGFFELSAVWLVLYTAYFAFMAGVLGHSCAKQIQVRRVLRSNKQLGLTWDFSFTPVGICYRNELMETRLAWRAVNAVEGLAKMIIFRFGAQAFAIPSRVFADDAARAGFVAAAAARIKAAAENAQP